MGEWIQVVFQKNSRIIDWISRAVIYFREGNETQGLIAMSQVTQDMADVAKEIQNHKSYFEFVSVDSVCEMIEGILAAKHAQDYVMLADLLEVQVDALLCNIQALIMKKEDLFIFHQDIYESQLQRFLDKVDNKELLQQHLDEAIEPEKLLEMGYKAELTSCGLMTVAKRDSKHNTYYLHSNHKVMQEAFLLARNWIEPRVNTYYIAGLGLGYHITMLCELTEKANIKVIERDAYMIQLCCAFSDLSKILSDSRVIFHYDVNGDALKQIVLKKEDEKLCIHNPSYRENV